MRAPLWLPIAVLPVWLAAAGVGIERAWRYERTPGPPVSAPGAWPTQAREPAPRARPRLMMFVHPQCGCSRAGLEELARVATLTRGRLEMVVYLFEPHHDARSWVGGELWRAAAAVPGAEVRADPGGAEARHFGAVTSGTTLLFSSDGRLVFEGGITRLRGHSGESAGGNAIVAYLNSGTASLSKAPVYGCSLLDSDRPQ